MPDWKSAAGEIDAEEAKADFSEKTALSDSTTEKAEEGAHDSEESSSVYASPLLAGSHDETGNIVPTGSEGEGANEKEEERQDEEGEDPSAPELPPPPPEVSVPEKQVPPPRDGVFEFIDEAGKRSVLTYKEGELTGPFTIFAPDGKPLVEGSFKNGELCGVCKTYEAGILRSEVEMDQGAPHGSAKQFDEKGALLNETHFVHGLKQGEMMQYGPDEEITTRATFADDAMNGPFEAFDQGSLTLKTTYKEGKLHGLMENFYSALDGGSCLRTATYNNGQLEGKEEIYHTSGSLVMEAEYQQGRALAKPIITHPLPPEGE